MAKDDYDVIVYRILVYLYGCLKHKIIYKEETFRASVRKHVDSEEYFAHIVRMMQEEELIEGLAFTKAWGGDVILLSGMNEARITAKGIHYLEENSKMNKVGQMLKESADLIAKLASILMLI